MKQLILTIDRAAGAEVSSGVEAPRWLGIGISTDRVTGARLNRYSMHRIQALVSARKGALQ